MPFCRCFLPPPFCSAHFPTGPRSTLAPGHELHTLCRVDLVFIAVYLGIWWGPGGGGGGQKNCLILPPTFALPSQTGRLLLKYDVPVKLKLQHPPGQPPRATPRAFELLRIGLFKFPPLGREIPLLRDKFRLQSNTVYACQREICRNDTFKLH